MYALCVSGAVNTQGFVWKFLCAIYEFSFIHSFHTITHEDAVDESRGNTMVQRLNFIP